MVTWPAALSAPALNSYIESPPKNTIRTQMDKGPSKVRRRTTSNVRPISFNLKLTPAEVTTLDTFYDTTTASGAIEFDYTHPRTSAAVTARFVSIPQYSEVEGVLYNCAIQLEILP